MDLFQINSEIIDSSLKQFNRTEKSLEDDVTALKDWMKTQKHLPEVMDDTKIRNFLVLTQCSVENAKQRIDMYYTIRSALPDVYSVANPNREKMLEVAQALHWVYLPKLTPDFYRVNFVKIKNCSILEKLDAETMVAYVFNMWELRLCGDLMLGDVLIVDMAGVTFKAMVKWTPPVLIKALSIYEKVYNAQLKGFYMINSPSFITHLSNVLGMIRKEVEENINIFSEGKEVLLKYFPKTMLPRDYGGDEKTVEELAEMVKNGFLDCQENFDKLDGLRVDESQRPQKLKNDFDLGIYGNFKKLEVD